MLLTYCLGAMIDTVATSLMAAAADTNCAKTEYSIISKKRWLPESVEKWIPSVVRRGGPIEEIDHATWCSTFEFAGVNYFNPYWRYQSEPGIINWLYVHLNFKIPPENKIFCDVMEAATAVFAPLVPEYVGTDVVLEEDIQINCDV